MTDLAPRDQVVATVHRLHLSLADKCREQAGATDEDIAIAVAYAARDSATIYADGDKANGITWLRLALDLIEAGQPITGETAQ